MSALIAPTGGRTFSLPDPVGPLTDELFSALTDSAGARLEPALSSPADPLGDDDLQLALYVCYELHYSHIEGVDERWEWAPSLLRFRSVLEQQMEDTLALLVPSYNSEEALDVGGSLQQMVADTEGPSLSRYLEIQGTLEEFLELVVHRSAYQLKEADPHSWAIPRLCGAPKAALLEVQFDEYGAGRAERMHSVLFAGTMLELGLDATYGAYVGRLPGITLATVNMLSFFGLHRRLRGALVGHLAVFEMTSSVANRRYGNALRRLGFGPAATDFYDEHVEADAVHESIATWDLADGLAAAEPPLAPQILFGAAALLAVEGRWAQYLLDRWEQGATSLLRPLS